MILCAIFCSTGACSVSFNGQRNVLVYSKSVLALNAFFYFISFYKSHLIMWVCPDTHESVMTLLQILWLNALQQMMERTLTSPNAAASPHVSREMRSTFVSCIFNIRLYKRCRTEPGVYESIEQRVMAAEGRLRARLNFLLLNVNEVRRKERSFSRALGPIVPWINHETSLTVA